MADSGSSTELKSSANDNEHIRVRSSYREKVPKHLVIDSCNLQLNESVGQGKRSMQRVAPSPGFLGMGGGGP